MLMMMLLLLLLLLLLFLLMLLLLLLLLLMLFLLFFLLTFIGSLARKAFQRVCSRPIALRVGEEVPSNGFCLVRRNS